jgi:hypothetical protein
MSIEVTSDKNYMKRQLFGSANMAAPVTSAAGGLFYKTDLVIPHNQGRVPYFAVYAELFGDGTLWPVTGYRGIGAANPKVNPEDMVPVSSPSITVYPDETNLTIELSYTDNSLTGVFPVYWVIYEDYGL